MRRQYHFMPDEDGQKAWDVQRLIELSDDLPVEDAPLAEIAEIDQIYWFDRDHFRPKAPRLSTSVKPGRFWSSPAGP